VLKDCIQHECRASGFAQFDKRKRHAIEMLSLFGATKGSLDTCESMMTWRMKCTGEIHPCEKASDSPHCVF